MEQDVWLVILNWNGCADTLDLLESLSTVRASVVVVDNGSTDGTLDAVRALYSSVHTLQTGSNLGYTGGNNAGIAFALAQGADVVGILNNDTLVESGFLEPLLAELTANRRVALSPDIRYADDPGRSWFRGSRIDEALGWPQHLAPLDQLSPEADPFRTPVLTGCCIIASADTWRLVGNFDDRLFLMFEDSDWSRRADDRGVELLVVPRSRIRHKVSRSFTGTAGTLGSYYFARNGLVFAARHLGVTATTQFLVRQLLRPSLRGLLVANLRREAWMSCLGALAAATGIRGPAGPFVKAMASQGIVFRHRELTPAPSNPASDQR